MFKKLLIAAVAATSLASGVFYTEAPAQAAESADAPTVYVYRWHSAALIDVHKKLVCDSFDPRRPGVCRASRWVWVDASGREVFKPNG